MLAGALGLVALKRSEQPLPGEQAAQAIERSMTPGPDAEALEDEALTGSASEAGYRWAERLGLDNPYRCPDYSAAFKAGCVSYVADQAEQER
jgi:hypothetical protein